MYLKSISMQGFKSFAKKINIDLENQVTGVVGPNGSGKSNVAEAIRFVLGEQSMKGLRSKSGSDLIFKGSKHLSALSRASVSIHLDNSDKKLNENLLSRNSETNEILMNFINLDEIILTREIYSDGGGEYLINNTKVRLKDVQELLAMANISASGHTIVNQGEADRILLSNNKERKEMIEEALGLRIYHMRIKEGEKKLEKVKIHLNEIELTRRENVPHLNYLKKQVKELEKKEEEIKSLTDMLKIYLYKENIDIENKKKESHNENIENRIQNLESELNTLIKSKEYSNNADKETNTKNDLLNKENESLNILNEKINIKRLEIDTIYKEIINIELETKFLINKNNELLEKKNLNKIKEDIEKYFINKKDFDNFEQDRLSIWQNIFELYNSEKFIDLKTSLNDAKNKESIFLNKVKNLEGKKEEESYDDFEKNFEKEIEILDQKVKEKRESLEVLNKELEILNNEAKEKRNNIEKINSESKEQVFRLDNNILKLKLDLEKLYSQKEHIKIKEESLKMQEENFDDILKEMSVLIGQHTFKYKSFNINEMLDNEKVFFEIPKHDLERKIERSKIKIEESGIVNASDITEEYKALSERDEFLIKEIADLENSKNNLENLIIDLKNTLLLDFNNGLEKINSNFNNYFNEIFPGGSASLSIEKIIKIKEIDNDIGNEDDEEIKEPGIDISINLPEKKVKDLQMLSGGERALSSIALIFAMSSINHPPFMVLDETDAALDEANARKYGKMIRKLAEKSKLLVITHNRETMNQCDVLYGVTIGAEGSSKLLSIKFDQAIDYAK